MAEAVREGVEVDFSHVKIKPIGAKEVRELEIALIIATMLRADIFKEILEPKEFTTWVDSLAIAAGALAREKAGYTVSKIAEELGRTEATIRNHLQGKTKAGKLVRETYEMLKKGKVKLALPLVSMTAAAPGREKIEEYERRIEELKTIVKEVRDALKDVITKLEGVIGERG